MINRVRVVEIVVVKLHISRFLFKHFPFHISVIGTELYCTSASLCKVSFSSILIKVDLNFKAKLKFNPQSIFFSSYRTFYFKSAEQMPPHILM